VKKNKNIEMERLEKRRCARWWLNREDSTDLRCEELMLYERDLFNRGVVN